MKRNSKFPDLTSVKAPLSEASFLPSEYYGNDMHFLREKTTILQRNWIVVGRWEQVENTGDYFTIDLFEEPIVIVRDQNNTVKALSNVCRHRAAAVAQGSGNTKHFVCPYHQWNYKLSGEFNGAPAMERATDFTKEECGLDEFPVMEWQGFIFVNLSKTAKPLDLTEVDDYIRPFHLSELKRLEPIRYDCPWDWKISSENVMEFYHYPGVHAKTVGGLFDINNSIDAEYEDSLLAVGGENLYALGRGKPYIFAMQASQNSLITPGIPAFEVPESLANKQVGVHVFPNISLIITPNFTVWPHFIIDNANSHRLEYNILVHPDLADKPEFSGIREYFREMIQAIHDEDMPVLKQVAKGLKSANHTPGRLSHLELVIWLFHTWMLEELG
ncbi:MAG: hypothetical protein COA99_05970 [Moraxellaceae bacterium]|nr:MAG: hypothetical protein COA99_05970 [Moraxellaceae bacterium]